MRDCEQWRSHRAARTSGNAGATSTQAPCLLHVRWRHPWGGITRVIYGLSERRLLEIAGEHPQKPPLSIPFVRFRAQRRKVEVIGPLLEDEAAEAHYGYWV